MIKQELKQAYKEAMNCTGFVNKETDTEYRLDIDYENKTVIVSFQGSGSKIDWRQNFTFYKKPYKHMKHLFFVHAGLFNKYSSVKDEIWSKIIPVLNPDWKIRIYGFSQGGTLASFMHEDAKYRLPELDVEGWAFAPAKGFTFWNRKYLKKRFEGLNVVINRRDIVPKLPFWFQGFIHYGHVNKIGKRGISFPWNWYKEHMGYKELI